MAELGPSKAELEAADCWFTVDRVRGDPAVTAFKRRARLHQARWREAQKLPPGSHRSGRPLVERPNGSRIGSGHPGSRNGNFLSNRIRDAVEDRLAHPEPHETLDEARLRTDLLSSMPMCFNLFGELHGDPARAAATLRVLAPGRHPSTAQVRFEWSPARRDNTYLGDRTAFDAAITFERADGSAGVVGIETKYHEHILKERPPNPKTRLPRYREVTERSEIFKPGWEKAIVGQELQQIWRDHLLVLSMLQHPSGKWTFGRYVLVHPAMNPNFAEAGARYRDLLDDDATFAVRTLEELLDEHVLHPPQVEDAFRSRYLWAT